MSEEESIEGSECLEKIRLSKKFWRASKRTMICAVLCVLFLILPNVIVAFQPFWEDVYVDQLPYYHEWIGGPYDVTLKVKNVTQNLTLAITFHKYLAYPLDPTFYVEGEPYGSIELGVTIFSVPISSNVNLTFQAYQMNITIVKVGYDGIINNIYDNVIVKGKTYAEEYQRFNTTLRRDEGFRAVVSIPEYNRHSLTMHPIQGTDLSYMTITESGIHNFSVLSGSQGMPEESIIPVGVKGIKLSTTLSEHFRFDIVYMGPEPPAFQTYPDLFVSSDDITFSNNTPDEGDVIWINATVRNIGEDDAGNFNVTAYLDLVSKTTKIGGPIIIPFLAEGDSAMVSFEWNTTDTYGDHIVRILVDEDNPINEINESNHASKHIFVNDTLVWVDEDNDGLPKFWEDKYNLNDSDNTGDNGSSGDPDHDGYNNTQEYENITNPIDPDTDRDSFLDGINNSLIELELKNMTLKNESIPPPPTGDYYIMMSEWMIQSGAKFPYAGYRVPTNTSAYWNLTYYDTINPNETLSIAYMVQYMPLNVYYRYNSTPVSRFYITVDKDELEKNKTEYIELNDTNFTLVVEATLLEYNFSDPDPLCQDSDWDGINDTNEVNYLTSRVLDFRTVDTDNDGLKNYLDVDSDNDNATDGKELNVYDHPEYVLLVCYSAIDPPPQITDPLNPDTEGDGLLDGDEMFIYHSNPLSLDSDNDSLGDYYEVKTWFFYTNVTLERAEFYDNKGKTTINIEDHIYGKYKAKIYGSAQIKNETEQNLSKALNITLRTSSTNITLPYELGDEPPYGTDVVIGFNLTYRFEFENDGEAIEILITSNGSVFHRITDFRLSLNYTHFWRFGISPIDEDTDRDGLLDIDELNFISYNDENPDGLAPANKDTDFDHFWDGAELNYWDIVHKLRTLEERVERAKIPDFDDDKLLDGDEVLFGIDPVNADPDDDEIGDYEELYQYVPMWRDELSQTVMGYCNQSGSFQYGSLCHNFTIKESDGYKLKLVSLDTINRTLVHYNGTLLNDDEYLAQVNNEFINQSSIINVTKDDVLLVLDFETDSIIVNKTIYGNYINMTERRYFTVTARLDPSQINYSISYDMSVTEENATVVMNFNQFVPSRQGLHPFKIDIDGDGLPDGIEAKIGSNPFEQHSDEDEINDFHEYEGTHGYKTDPTKEDTDGDELWDGYNITGICTGELSLGTNSTNVDTDGDTLWDGENVSTNIGELSVNTDPLKADTDNDTMPDPWEVEYCLQPRNASDANEDADDDNLLNAQEYTVGTIPQDNDTDDDGVFDGDEILGVLFRTNIIKGAVSIENYGMQEGYKWIFYNGTDWKKYEYSNESIETETQVTSNGSSQINPAIYGDYIVWQDDRNSSAGWDIYLYSLSCGEEMRITTNVSNQTNPAIFGDYIVWQDDRNSSAGWDIYLYNITADNKTRITVNVSNQEHPCINGDIIIWVDDRNANSTNGWQKEIYMYNIKNEVEIRVTNDTIKDDPNALLPNQTYPWICESSVVWLDDKYNGSNVYLHQAAGGKYLTNDSFEQKNPKMYGDIVVWEDYRNGNADIYMYEVLKDNITQITTNASNQTNPYFYGDNILWEDYRNGNADIYLFNITTSITIQLTNNSENQTAPVAYGDRFVWIDDRNGNQDIYMYNLTHLITLQDNTPVYYNNDNNEIYVWKANARYYRFNETSNAAVNTHHRPLNGYRYRELYEGPSPFNPDSDADGVYDGQEPYWDQDNDTDSRINALDTDSDGDGVPDGREVRVGYRTNADEGKYDAESWVAIDINVSDEMYVLKGFWFNVSANDTNMGSIEFIFIEALLTPEGKKVYYNSSNEFIRIGETPNASYFAENDTIAIKTENYGKARYTANRQETTFVVDYSVDDDSIPNIIDNDSDDDGIVDGTEPLWYQDLDDDGYENMVDRDSDGDGLEDGTEDWNYNGVVDDNETSTIDVDTDHDGIWDCDEPDWNLDTDGDGLINAVDIDSDGDGVMDSNEVRVVYRTNALKGQYNSSSWVAVALPHDGLDPWENDTYPPYGHNLTEFWYHSVSSTPNCPVIGKTPEGADIYYDINDTCIYISGIKFAQTHIWKTKAPLNTSREFLTSSVVDGKIFVIGGNNGTYLSTVEEYDPINDTWTTKTPMSTPRDGLTTSTVNGKIYVIGGRGIGNIYLSTVEEYDPSTDTWTTKTSMPTPRGFLTSSAVNGKIYVIGGMEEGDVYLSTVEEYNPINDTWTTKTSMPTPRGFLTSSAVNGKIYVIGGCGVTNLSSVVEEYNPSTDTWTTKAPLPTARHGLASSAVNGKIYAIGGTELEGMSSVVEEYTPSTNTWTTKTPLPTPRYALTSSPLNNRVYAIGGFQQAPYFSEKVEEYIYSDGIDTSTIPTLAYSYKRQEVIVIFNVTHNGTKNILLNDSDDDGLQDGLEDANGNGVLDMYETNPWLKDTDNDGISDGIEDKNKNGTKESNETDPLNVDTDGDGLYDGWHDLDEDGEWDVGIELGEDYDADGEIDIDAQGYWTETDPNNPDTDGDAIIDGTETGVEGFDSDNATTTDPLDIDSDDDGIVDGDEDKNHNGMVESDETDPLDTDTDDDALWDGLEVGKNLTNIENPSSGIKGTNTSSELFATHYDYDTSTITDPIKNDTDSDNLYDGWQDLDEDGVWDVGIELGEDYDADGEVDIGETDPLKFDTDADGLSDGDEVRTSTFWYEAENYAFDEDQIVNDSDASGGKAIKNRTTSSEIFKIIQNLPAQNYKYKLYVKANKTKTVNQGQIEITVDNGIGIITHTLQIRGSTYDWYSSEILEFNASTQITVYGNDTGTRPSAYTDKILLVNASTTKITSLYNSTTEVLFEIKSGGNRTVYAEIPKNTYATKASMNLAGCELKGWSNITPMPAPRSHFACSVVNGKIYVIGGLDENAKILSTVLEYDPYNDTWTNKTSMNTARYALTSSEVNGKIYAIGGYEFGVGQTTTVEEYDPSTNTWTNKTPINEARYGLTSSVVNGKIYAIGGVKFGGIYFSTVEEYDPATDSWVTKSPMINPRSSPTSSVVDGKIYVIGGHNNHSEGYVLPIEEYDTSNDTWTTKGPILTARTQLASSVVDNKIYAIGGVRFGSALDIVEEYDPSTDMWRTKTPMLTLRGRFASSAVGTKIYAIGGWKPNIALDLVEVYEPTPNPTNPTLDVGGDGDIQWYHNDNFFDTETAPDFADEINEYIFNHRNELTSNGTYLVPLKFHSDSRGKIVLSNISITLEPHVSDPLDNDTDGDGLDDYVELNAYNTHAINIDSDNDNVPDLVELMINGTGIGTDPADHDTDGDWLWDGFEDLDGDGEFDPVSEVGENIDLDYEVDYNETHPLDPDSDNDRLLDGIERIPYVLWWEAENYTKNEATQKVEDSANRASRDYAATSTTSNEIFVEIIQNIPSDTLNYKLYIKARKSGTSNGFIEIYKDSSSLDTIEIDDVEYQWYSTTDLEFITSSSITIEMKNTTTASTAVFADKVMLVNISRLSVTRLVEGETPYNVTFTEEGNITVNLSIPIIGTVPKYVTSANITLQGIETSSYPKDPYMNLGDNTNYTLHQWGWLDEFSSTSTTLDLAGEMNMYIARHINDGPGVVNDEGCIRIPLTFYSKNASIIKIIDVDIKLGPYVTDALDNDTDSDWLHDGDEVDVYGTYSLSWDSDNDDLFDVVEPVEGIGTNPTDSDTENDMLGDGEEVKVIFRTDDTSGSFDGYNDNTWIAVPDYMKIDLDEGTFWVPFNPKGTPSSEKVDSATNDTGYYLLWREGNSWNSEWKLAWRTTSSITRYFNGTITSDGTFSISTVGTETEDIIGLSNGDTQIDINASADENDNNDLLKFSLSGGSWLKFDLEIDENHLYTNIFIGIMNSIPPSDPFEYHVGSLVSYGHVGNVSELPSTATKIAYNASGDYEMYVNEGNASIYIDTKDGNYSIYERGHVPVPSDEKLSLKPTMPYPILDLEVYANSALDFDKDNDGIVDGIDLDPSDADYDDDGLLDGYEYYNLGTDPNNNDTDGDGLKDGTECGITLDDVFTVYWNTDINELIFGTDINSDNFTADLDPGTRTNPLKKDTDNDGLWDGINTAIGKGEDINKNGRVDVNGEGYLTETDPNVVDTDWDDIIDGVERGIEGFDLDTETTTSPLDIDSDDDGIADGIEDKNHNGKVDTHETDPNDTDTDDDGLWDGPEVGKNLTNIKTPRSGIKGTDTSSGKFGTHYDHDTSTTTDPLSSDSDEDGLWDGWEEVGTPNNQYDPDEFGEDTNANGMVDLENDYYIETDPNLIDTDSDGINDGVERGLNGYDSDSGSTTTDPLDIDTDDDGIIDGKEDKDYDGEVDIDETDPNDTDTDSDRLWDGLEVGKNLTNIEMPRYGINGTDTDESSDKFGTHYDHDTSTTTNPLSNDTDNDGIPDGWIDGWTYTRSEGWHQDITIENYNGSKEIWEGEDLDLDGAYEPDIDSKSETDPNSKDSDGDGIPDGFEFVLSAQYLDESFGLNPLNASDASEDLDNDTFTNLEEYEQGVNSNDLDIDADDDNNINFYDENDDNDPWPTIIEIFWSLEPYLDEYSDQYDFDNDGLGNKFEWDNEAYVNLTTSDGDGDGLEDGWEYDYWKNTRSQTKDNAFSYCSKYDTDGDGVSDGQEINGYQVTISWYEGEDLKSKDIKVYGDPMGAYKDPDGNFLDVDDDGIFDIDEIDPKNSTRLSWYFETLKHDPRPQSEKDEQVQNQFSPFIRENIPPKIENVGVKTDCKIKWIWVLFVPVPVVEHCWSRITVEISDVSEFTVKIKVLDNGKYVTFTGVGNEVFEATIDIDWWTDYLIDYRVRITATDAAGNEVEWEDKINGVFGGLLDALAAIWNAIVGIFKAAFELIVAALSFLVDLIINVIKAIIDAVLAPIIESISNWVNNIASAIHKAFLNTADAVEAALAILDSVIFASGVMYLFIGLSLVLMGIDMIKNGLVGLGQIIGIIFQKIVPLIIGVIVGRAIVVAVTTIQNEVLSIIDAFLGLPFAMADFFVALFLKNVKKQYPGVLLKSVQMGFVYAGLALSMVVVANLVSIALKNLGVSEKGQAVGALIFDLFAVILLILARSAPRVPRTITGDELITFSGKDLFSATNAVFGFTVAVGKAASLIGTFMTIGDVAIHLAQFATASG